MQPKKLKTNQKAKNALKMQKIQNNNYATKFHIL